MEQHNKTCRGNKILYVAGNVGGLMSIKDQVKQFWNKNPCGIIKTEKEFGTKKFFDEVEKYRYSVEYHIPEVAGFDNWKGKKLLEIGCGIGTDLIQFARGGAIVTGVDFSPRAVQITKDRFNLFNLPGEFAVADSENLPFGNSIFDLVYSHGVLHHIPNTQKAVDEIYRVLKPGGKTIVMLYHKNSYNYRVNILLIRKIAFALIRDGFPVEKLSRIAGVDISLLQEYARVIKGKSRFTIEQLLNNNTDGPGNPLSKVYSKDEARKLFHAFQNVRTEVYYLCKKNIPVLSKLLPHKIDYSLGRFFGWFLYVYAEKS